MNYRIENRSAGLTLYWDRDGDTWDEWPNMATVYTEAERTESLRLHVAGESNEFPEGGQWVVIPDKETVDGDLRCSTAECDGRITEEGDQCVNCRAREAYWQWQWEQYGRQEVEQAHSRRGQRCLQ